MKNILRLPQQMRDIHTLLQSLDWDDLEEDVRQESQARLVIVGPVNSGKSTLFNYLHSRKLSATGAVPGITKGNVEYPLGPFLLVDTPGFGEVWGVDRAETARAAATTADLVLLVLDAVAGVRQSDHDLYQQLLTMRAPVIIVLNKVDLVKNDLPWILENAKDLLGVTPIPISATLGTNVIDKLLPAILAAQPAVAVAMARSLPGVRAQLVNRIVRRTAWTNALISLEPVPGLDIPLLLASQTRMVLRIAAAYGESMSISHARELLTTMAGSLLSRYLGLQLAKLLPGPGWLISAAMSAVGTWGIGQAAHRYFQSGGKIKGPDLKAFYRRMRRLAPRQLFKRRRADDTEDSLPEPDDAVAPEPEIKAVG